MNAVLEAIQPGIYDMPEDVYHADPVPGGSLSSTGARKLLACPAKFDWERKHPRPSTAEMEFGTAAHKMNLGAGPQIEVIHAKDWRTKAAKDAAETARADSKVPLLAQDYETVLAMAAAIRSHEWAGHLFDGTNGKPEQTLIWQDAETGIWCRARLDWLPDRHVGRRMVLRDYKTTKNASKAAIAKSVADYGYHQQAAFYIDGVRALGLDADPAFIFAFQEKDPPYVITVAQLDADAIRAGRLENRRALEKYRDCTQAGMWPGYSLDIELISLPAWKLRAIEEDC